MWYDCTLPLSDVMKPSFGWDKFSGATLQHGDSLLNQTSITHTYTYIIIQQHIGQAVSNRTLSLLK